MRKTLMAAALGAAMLVPGAGSALAAPSHATASKAAVSVAASNFKFKLSKASVAEGHDGHVHRQEHQQAHATTSRSTARSRR